MINLDTIYFLGAKSFKSGNKDLYMISFYGHKDDFAGKDYEYEGATCFLDSKLEYELVKDLQPFDSFKGLLVRNGRALTCRVLEVGDDT